MEHLTSLTEQQQIERKEAFAKQHAAWRDAEREEDATRAREAEERGRPHAKEQGPKSDAHPTTDPVQQMAQSLSGASIHQEQQPTHQAATAIKKARLGLFSREIILQFWIGCLEQERIESRECWYSRHI